MRVQMMTLAACLALGGCATRPQVAHEGQLPAFVNQGMITEAAAAETTGADAVLAKTIQDKVLARVSSPGAAGAGASMPRYRLQVAVATSPGEVGISTGAGPEVATAPWRGVVVKRHFWNRRGPMRTATLSVLDLTSGKVVAWSSVRASSADPDLLAGRLVSALSAT